jgi:hypothetical protein
MRILVLISFWLALNVTVLGQEQVRIALNDSVRLTLVKDSFHKASKKIVYWDSTKQAISSIDGRPVYGTDAIMPESELTSAYLHIRDKKINLNVECMYDPWQNETNTLRAQAIQHGGNPLKVQCLLSNGAGTYLAEWIIIENKSFRTMITSDMAIIDTLEFN